MADDGAGGADGRGGSRRADEVREEVGRLQGAPTKHADGRRQIARRQNCGATAAASSRRPPPIAIRTNFNPLAAFSPAVKTGADGRAIVDVKVPDNLTRYRVIAIAVAGDKQFGKGESAITARLPLMVRPTPPRFLNFGDTFELPVVVQNQTDAPMTVRLAARTDERDAHRRRRPRGHGARERSRRGAVPGVGGAARARRGSRSSAPPATRPTPPTFELPVWTPATTEAFATYGVIDERRDRSSRSRCPGKVVDRSSAASRSRRRRRTSRRSPTRCSTSCTIRSSAPSSAARAILAIAALARRARRVQDEGHADAGGDGASRRRRHRAPVADAELRRRVRVLGSRLSERAVPDRVRDARARHARRPRASRVPQNMLDARASRTCATSRAHYPCVLRLEVRRAISAYALYTRKQMGDLDIAKAQAAARRGRRRRQAVDGGRRLAARRCSRGNAGAAAERKAIVRHALNHVSETAGAANFDDRLRRRRRTSCSRAIAASTA